jgi:murein tripeptide amidase MpaA
MKSLIFLMFVALAAGLPQAYHTDDFLSFWDLHKMEHYLEHLNEDHDFVTVRSIGKTSEGRDIQAVGVSLPHRGKEPKHHRKIVIVESGLHAREWIAPMVNLYLIHMLVEHHPEYEYILENVDFVFIPMANPDGYEYSHTVDRNWNKNRRLIGRSCYGVDLNRNFDFQYLPYSDPCDEHYGGHRAASEAETQAIQQILDAFEGKIAMYISLQAHGQQILTPYNYAPVNGDNHRESMMLASKVARKIKEFNDREYKFGPGGRLLETPERGTSSDYAHGVKNVPLAFTVKLPAGGDSGYEVPEDQLDSILTESWFGFLEFVNHINTEDIMPY